MYQTIRGLLNLAEERKVPLQQIVLENEMALSGKTEEEVYELLEQHYAVMVGSATKALSDPQAMPGRLVSGRAAKQNNYQGALSGDYLNKIMAMALSGSEVNASMGLVCAAPTGGASGVLPAVLYATEQKLNASLKEMLDALLVASGIGAVITQNATVSGAEGGCQAECGVAAAMAAAALVNLVGGSPEAVSNAVAISLMNCMGLVCDPVGGLVQLPCAFRNASQAVNAVISADLALAGQQSIIPADEVVDALYRVGRQLPMELRETALGGIAITPTAKAIAARLAKDAESSAEELLL